MDTLDLPALLEQAIRNPAGLQRVAIDYIQSRLDGDTIPDPLAPLVQLLEIASAQTVVGMNQSLALDRERYALLAATTRDLYKVMSDKDYMNRFAMPSKAPLYLWLDRDLAISLMEPVGTTGVRKLTIPRYTTFTILNEYSFTLLYPIEIRQINSDSLQVVYNTDILSPLQTLGDNVIPWYNSVDAEGTRRIRLDIEVLQLKRTFSYFQTLDGAANNFSMLFDDQYFYARVFRKVGKTWVDMRTTHTEQMHDARYPTAFLKVDTGAVNIVIPPIYFANGMVTDEIRVDIYTTRGALEVPISQIDPSKYNWDFGDDLDDPSQAAYWKGLPNLSMTVFSDGLIHGGSDGMDFETLREVVISRATNIDTPIMPGQVAAKLQLNGYGVMTGRDDLTTRIFYATRPSPSNPASKFPVPISSGIVTMQNSMEFLSGMPGVYDNGNRMTISPKMLMVVSKGVTTVVAAENYPEVIATTTDNLISQVNSLDYIYTPFHYVLDASGDNFQVRAYYLENPILKLREFLSENQKAGFSVSTQAFSISRTTTGYQLLVNCLPSTAYEKLTQSQVHLQLGFIPAGESEIAYQNGTLLGIINGVWTWQFLFDTKFDLTLTDDLIVQNFFMFTTDRRETNLPLTTRFLLIHSITDFTESVIPESDVDSYVGRFLLQGDANGIQLEAITLELGTPLTNLWRGNRTVGGSRVFLTYDEDVLDTYSSDVYVLNPSTGKPDFTIVDGKIQYQLLHRKGDPKMGSDGKQLIKFYKGQVKVDPITEEPVVVSERPTLRILDLFVMDGRYFYANDETSLADRKYLPDRIADTYLPAIMDIVGKGFERTAFSFFPRTTIGEINVIVDDSRSVMISSRLSLTVKTYLTDLVYNSTEYKTKIESMISSVINRMLMPETVSILDIMAQLRAECDEDVKGIELQMMSGGEEVNTFSAGDESVRSSIGRLLVLRDDGSLGLKEDITFSHLRHTTKTESFYATTINKMTQV